MRVTQPTGDDWIARVRCRAEGREWTVWKGCSGQATREVAEFNVRKSINTPRRVHDGRAAKIIDMEIARMWEWKAKQMIETAPERFGREVNYWQKRSERVTA